MTISIYAINTDYRNLMTEKLAFTRHIVVEVDEDGQKVSHDIGSKTECENLIETLLTLINICWGQQ